MSSINIVKNIKMSEKDMEHIEELAKNKLSTLSNKLMPVAKHLTTGIISNVGIIKLSKILEGAVRGKRSKGDERLM